MLTNIAWRTVIIERLFAVSKGIILKTITSNIDSELKLY